jgi:hypothetical protein
MPIYRILADLIVVVHAAYVAFVVCGLVVTWIGALAGWNWVRNPWFRTLHLVLIGIVAAESLADITCPLTTWEDNLRAQAGETVSAGSFIGRWMHDLIFVEVSPWILTTIYCLFGLLVLVTFLIIPPRLPNWLTRARNRGGG